MIGGLVTHDIGYRIDLSQVFRIKTGELPKT